MSLTKIAAAVAMVAALSVNIAWAQKNPADITIGYSAMQLSNPWYVSARAGMVAACRELGIKCVIIDAQNRVDKQVSDLQNMVHDRFDAIACTPLDAEALQDLYAQANNEGIITGSLAQIVPGSQLEYGIDEYQYGYTIGKQAAEWARSTLQCRGKVVLITQDNVLATIPRADGAEAALKDSKAEMTALGASAKDVTAQQRLVSSTLAQAGMVKVLDHSSELVSAPLTADLEEAESGTPTVEPDKGTPKVKTLAQATTISSLASAKAKQAAIKSARAQAEEADLMVEASSYLSGSGTPRPKGTTVQDLEGAKAQAKKIKATQDNSAVAVTLRAQDAESIKASRTKAKVVDTTERPH